MKITIVQEDGIVGVDGAFFKVDLAELDQKIHAIQFDTVMGAGHIEYDDILVPRLENAVLTDFSPYAVYLTRWQAAAAPKPPPPTVPVDAAALRARDLARKRAVALNVMLDAMLTVEAAKVTAPQELKDYALALRS